MGQTVEGGSFVVARFEYDEQEHVFLGVSLR